MPRLTVARDKRYPQRVDAVPKVHESCSVEQQRWWRQSLSRLSWWPLHGVVEAMAASRPPAAVAHSVLAAQLFPATAQPMLAGRAAAWTAPRIQPATALQSSHSARQERSRFTLTARSALHVGLRRTTHAIVLLRWGSATSPTHGQCSCGHQAMMPVPVQPLPPRAPS